MHCLVRLFDEMLCEALMRLLPVPRAPARCPERRNQAHEALKRRSAAGRARVRQRISVTQRLLPGGLVADRRELLVEDLDLGGFLLRGQVLVELSVPAILR